MIKTNYSKKGLFGLLILGAAGLSVARQDESAAHHLPEQLLAEKQKMSGTKTDHQQQRFPFEGESLRDPFWIVGSFPPEWGKEKKTDEQNLSASEWRAPAARLQVNGVSRMGNRVMALINNELYSVGDVVELAHNGKTFQWKVTQIQPDGNVQFERHEIITDASGSATQ